MDPLDKNSRSSPPSSGHNNPQQVAVIGTGLAGLTTAYLLNSDPEKRYHVTLIDQSPRLAFDSSSLTVENGRTGSVERIDVPMRASAGGYYNELGHLYAWLGIKLHPVRFLFRFSEVMRTHTNKPNSGRNKNMTNSRESLASNSHASPRMGLGELDGAYTYFVHASNLHQFIPPRPPNRSLLAHLFETVFLLVWYLWFYLACLTIQPYPSEPLSKYVSRVGLSRRFTSRYLLPLMSSVSTCSHEQMLDFPASDVTNYKLLSTGQHHYTVCGGVSQVQDKLVEDIRDIKLGRSVYRVEPQDGKVVVHWKTVEGGQEESQVFDKVVLAVSPNVVGEVFEPLQSEMKKIPFATVESSVVAPKSERCKTVDGRRGGAAGVACMHHQSGESQAQSLIFRSEFQKDGTGQSEAAHTMPSGVVVKTLPRDGEVQDVDVLQSSKFVRTLRSVQSRAIVENIMTRPKRKSIEEKRLLGEWANGDDNVWLAGSWCWDGMVLLEGCVVSAERVAEDLGVDIPWRA